MLANNLKKLLLVLDHAPPHLAKALQKYLASKKISLQMIPRTLTGILQPGDTHWFSSMKKYIYNFFHNIIYLSKTFALEKLTCL